MAATEPGHDAVVLAAGGSRRLGRPKQLLTRDGEPLVRRAARLAAATGPRRLLVVTGAGAEAIIDALAGIDAQAVPNPRWSTGLASSLQAACAALADDPPRPLLVLACDQPALELEHLRMLLATAAPGAAAATSHAGRAGPPCVLPPALLARAGELAGDRGFGPLLAGQPDTVVLDFPELLLDIDDDVALATARSHGLVDA